MSKVKDLHGGRFGRLTVTGRSDSIRGRAAWNCLCDCGGNIRALGNHLLSGNTKSCGCLAVDTTRKMGQACALKVSSGDRFGRLVVVGRSDNVARDAAYICKCDCGEEVVARASDLVNKKTVSCKCRRLEAARENGRKRKTKIEEGAKFGRLVVRSEHGRSGFHITYQCNCECGNSRVVKSGMLTAGDVSSCGCWKSRYETELRESVKVISPSEVVVSNDRTILSPKEIDIWLPDRNLGIEFNGLYWHGEKVSKDKLAAYEKYRRCQELGIRLVTVFEDEWVKNRQMVGGYLRSILGQKKTVGARKCIVERSNGSEFFDAHHLQGAARGEHYRLVSNGDTVAVAAFLKTNPAKAMGAEGVWELTRYAALPELSVAGGCSKLLQAFLRDTPECRTIISYSDNRWSAGGMYKAMGFRMEIESPPSFSYFRNGTLDRVHRFNWRKSEALRVYGGSSEETEWEIMQRNGWDRIWDCGKKRWELEVTKAS